MRIPARLLACATLAAAAFGMAAPADAACAGTSKTVIVCTGVNRGGLPTVNPTGGSIEDCVYLGSGQCTPVVVPIPSVTPGSGDILEFGCGGDLIEDFVYCTSPL